MSSLETRKIEPVTGTTVTLGAGGDTVLVSASQLKTNTVKDAGGNTIFTSDGAGTFSSVNSAIAGSMTFISSQTASDSSLVAFTSGIDSTYDEYVFYIVNYDVATNAQEFGVQFSSDGGSTYGITKTSTFFYAEHTESDGTAVLTYPTGSGSDREQQTAYQHLDRGNETHADSSGCGCFKLFSPSSTTYVKQFLWTGNNHRHSGGSNNTFVGGYLNTTAAINAVSFKSASGNITAGAFYLYGIS